MRGSSLSWVLPLALALTLHHVLASSNADAQTSAQEREDAASVRSKRGLNMLRLGRGLQMLRLGKRGSEFDSTEFGYSPNLDPLLFQQLMQEWSEPTDEGYDFASDGYYTPDGGMSSRYRRSPDDMPYDDEDMEDESFAGDEEKRALGMLRLGKRPMGMLRLGKRQLPLLRMGKRQLGMLRLGKRPMGMLRLGKRPMGMLRLGKRPMECCVWANDQWECCVWANDQWECYDSESGKTRI